MKLNNKKNVKYPIGAAGDCNENRIFHLNPKLPKKLCTN